MIDVLIALAPATVWAIIVFQQYAVASLLICVASCIAAEALFTALRRKPDSIGDGSAIVTGVILALSLPAVCGTTTGWYIGVIGGFVAIGLGKVVFGSLGQNIFNPAMVGRAFVMLAFTTLVGASGYVIEGAGVDAITQATPMTDLKNGADVSMNALLLGWSNGSPGEVHAIACLLGGLYLCIRRTASWQIPAAVIVAAAAVAGLSQLAGNQPNVNVGHHVLGGALLFGAFFIATDPVSSPLTRKGKWIFGAGVGTLVMLIRLLSGYPEGVMYAVLLMNAVVPLINRWTIPKPVGGPVP